MSVVFTTELLAILVVVLLTAGIVNGLAGFGFAVVGTMALATVIPPAIAVVMMIVPIVAANLTLVTELTRNELVSCGKRFAPLVGAALVGTIVGMALLDLLPDEPLRLLLGIITLGFVASQQRLVALPSLSVGSQSSRDRPAVMVGVGVVSGLLFGATNVGVQLVAYLRSLSLSHGLFVGVVAMVFLGVNGVRVAAAGALGLYPTMTIFWLSVAGAVPAVAGVAVGSRIREQITTQTRRAAVLGLLTVIGIRLSLAGLGVL